MIYEKGLAPNTVIHNLRVDRVARGNPLVYRVTCLRPECGGTFQIDHNRLVNLGKSGFCQWPGCSEAEAARKMRDYRPKPMRITKGFDTNRPLEGQESYNLKVQNRVSSLSETISYWVKCMLCNSQWQMDRGDLLSLTGYTCRNVTCRLEMERAQHDRDKESTRRANAALSLYGG